VGKSKRENEMIYTILLGIEAEKDVMAAYCWYQKYSLQLAESFKEYLDFRIEGLKRNPLAPSFVFKNYRSTKIQRFPHNIIFRVEDTEIQVIAVFHSSRNPDAWKIRI
jgi:toxin ParE1/3/4